MSSGACPHGQGMETVFAQIAAEVGGGARGRPRLRSATRLRIPMGFGTLASRSTVTVSGAIHLASERLKEKMFAIAGQAARMRRGRPGAARRRASAWSACRGQAWGWPKSRAPRGPDGIIGRPPGIEAGLEETYYFEPPTVTWAYAAQRSDRRGRHRARARSPSSATSIAHDCGVVVNPMLAEGQMVGGAVQGLGGALGEGIAYDSRASCSPAR